MRIATVALLTLALSTASALAAQKRTTLDIYTVDVEGGNATLFVTPLGESVLIDAGNVNGAERDVGRIMEAAGDAGITQIDHFILTHYHADHYGGLEVLSKQIPILEFIDYGPSVEPGSPGAIWERDVYPKLYAAAKHTVAKPGDIMQLGGGVEWRIVASAGEVASPFGGAGEVNPVCASFEPSRIIPGDSDSVASYITFGQFRTTHLGDVLRDLEFALMCPNTRLPPVQVLLGMHHGTDSSNSTVLNHGLRPRVAIMNNGTRKGGQPYTIRSIMTAPGFEDLWQMHFSLLSGQEYTVPGMFIANTVDDQPDALPIAPMPRSVARAAGAPPPPVHDGPAYWIEVSAQRDGTFTVTNTRNNFSKTYTAR